MSPKEIYEVYYHPNHLTRVFKYAFESYKLALDLVKAEFPNYEIVPMGNTKFPLVTIIQTKEGKEMIKSCFKPIK